VDRKRSFGMLPLETKTTNKPSYALNSQKKIIHDKSLHTHIMREEIVPEAQQSFQQHIIHELRSTIDCLQPDQTSHDLTSDKE
jgi:hypothetical protein